jgi:tetratricopeptide (TPR) repeat protein
MLTTVKRFEIDRAGLLLFNIAGGILLYFVVPALGFPDIRFIPVAQLFTCLLAADFLAWIGSRLHYPLLYAACVVAVALTWGHEHIGYIPSWLKWNYSGYEGKPTWPLFKAINEHLAGDMNDPRVMFEHSEAHNRFGSSRAFENLPLFSGRSTLEGVFHQASQSSPFIFYLQSEASERASGPFPQYTYTRLDPAGAAPHMRLFNVSHIVTVSEKAKAAYSASAEFERTFTSGAYAVFALRESDSRYVVPATNQPVLYEGADWKLAFYRWYKHVELLDIPLIPNALIHPDEARDFSLRTETIARLPKVPLEGDCDVTSRLENYRITFDTTCPDRPHIVKVSYFPRWSAGDTARLFPVSPGFMIAYPRARHVEITYERTVLDQAGVGLSVAGLSLLLLSVVSRRSRDAVTIGMATAAGPLLRVLERHYVLASTIVVLALIGTGAYTRWALREPERTYQEAQTAYRNRDFPEAIRRFEAWTSVDQDTFKQATALHQLGVSYGDVGQHASAVEVLERLRFQFPNVDYGAATLFHLAKSWRALGADERAREYAVLLSVDFGESPLNERLQREEPSLFSADASSPTTATR